MNKFYVNFPIWSHRWDFDKSWFEEEKKYLLLRIPKKRRHDTNQRTITIYLKH